MRAVHQRQRKENSRKSEKDKTRQAKVKLFCRKCQVFACSGGTIRCIKEAHHVVNDDVFRSKFSFRRNKCPRMINGVELTGLWTFIFNAKVQVHMGARTKYMGLNGLNPGVSVVCRVWLSGLPYYRKLTLVLIKVFKINFHDSVSLCVILLVNGIRFFLWFCSDLLKID